MFRKNPQTNDEIDRLGRIVLISAAQNAAEEQAAASSSFLYTRLRARIAEEQRRRNEMNGWLPILLIARRAVPAMASIALVAAMLTTWSVWRPSATTNFDDDVLLDSRDNGVEQVVLADRNNLSRDEIFNIVLERNYGRDAK